MQKVRGLLLLLGLCWLFGQGAFLYAQNEDDDQDSDGDEDTLDIDEWDGYISDLYAWGDQTFTISAGVAFPVGFLNNGKKIEHNFSPPIGGVLGPLAYSYFLDSHFFVGAEFAFNFMYTLGQNTAFFFPFGLRAGGQFIINRFEFPLYVTAGGIIHKYMDSNYFGLFLKGGVSGYFRFNPNWSFGLGADFSWYPQWPKKDGKRVNSKDVDGFLIGVGFSARYHF